MTLTSPHRRASLANGISKAEQRRRRLLEAEAEQANEEKEALKIIDEQQRLLVKLFATVKAEFSDLDGLRWTQCALQKLQAESPATHPCLPSRSHELGAFSSEDTIRISSLHLHSFLSVSQANSAPYMLNDIRCRHRDGSRSRPPITSIFGCDKLLRKESFSSRDGATPKTGSPA